MSQDSQPYILVLDNGTKFSALLAKTLRDTKIVVFRATDLYTAKRKIAQQKPELIFFWEGFYSDRECYNFCQEIRKIPTLSGIPYVVISALVSDTNKERAKKCGANGIISATIDSKGLRDKIAAFMSENN